MKIFLAILCGGAVLAAGARGENMKTLAGQTYSNIVVQQFDQEGFVILHDGGQTNVFFREISPELRGHYKALSMIPVMRDKVDGEAAAPAGPGDIETLSGMIYRNAEVKKIEDRQVLIAHDTGMDTVYFSSLSKAMREKVRRMPVVADPAPGPRDIVTTYGQMFRNTEILLTEPDGLTFRHDGGETKLGFPALGEEMQEKHGFDPIQAWKYARDKAAARRAAEEPVVAEEEEPTGPPTFEVYAIETQRLEDEKYWVRFAVRNITDDEIAVDASPAQEQLVSLTDSKIINIPAQSKKELQQFVVYNTPPTYLKLFTDTYRTNCLLTWE